MNEAPLKCPQCQAQAIKETRVRLPRMGVFVEQKGVMEYACGGRLRWEYNGATVAKAMVAGCVNPGMKVA